jgi:aminobenzoyl-glutamate utilization protein B
VPTWSDADQALAKGIQAEKEIAPLDLPSNSANWNLLWPNQGGSDDIGDISWNVPTITLRYPSNIPGLPGHWANAVSMATPITKA